MSTEVLRPTQATPAVDPAIDTEFVRRLDLFDSTMLVVGSMIGSGIFLVSAEMARQLGSPGWLLVAWIMTGVLTVAAALSYGELAAMMPRAGGQYVYLREAFSPLLGFLYGWTLFMVIQTGTIAAVAVGFARYFGVLWPWISEDRYLIAPIFLSSRYAISLSTTQLVGILLIALLTWTNTRGLSYGKIIQNLFTVSKTGALLALIVLGLALGWNATAVEVNFGNLWNPRNFTPIAPGLAPDDRVRSAGGPLRLSDRIALFRGRVEQHHVHSRRGQGSATECSARAGNRHRPRHGSVLARKPRVPGDPAARADSAGAGGPSGHGCARSRIARHWNDLHGRGHHGLNVRMQ